MVKTLENPVIGRQLRSEQGLRSAFSLLAALACGTIFFYMGHRVLGGAHPADDAYILYRYAENLAAGHGIVFNIGGPRSEGATDFLWLLLLAGSLRLGADVALASLALNAIGAALAGYLLARLCWGKHQRPYWSRAALLPLVPWVVLSGGALSAYLGFSTMLYSALILLLYVISVEGRGRALAALPIVGLILALFRPDGAIIAAATVLLGVWPASSERVLRPYLGVVVACALAGILYFVIRWQYFGQFLPLPLYVKQHATYSDLTGMLKYFPGLSGNWRWFAGKHEPWMVVAATGCLLAFGHQWRDPGIRRALVFLLPLVALLLALSFAIQSQNVQFRFQAPVHLVLIYALGYIAGRAIDEHGQFRMRALVVALCLFAVIPSSWTGFRDTRWSAWGKWNTYLEAFSVHFGPAMEADTVVALTEAGILPYMSNARIFDMVGLTNPDTARHPPTMGYIERLDPDLIFYNHAKTLDNRALAQLGPDGSRMFQISPDALREALRDPFRKFLERDAKTYNEVQLANTKYAAIALTRFLSESSSYDILAVDFLGNGRYAHIYGLKRSWRLRDSTRDALYRAFQGNNYRSYLEVRRDMKSSESK